MLFVTIQTEKTVAYLGAFTKLRTPSVSFVMSVRLSLRPTAWKNTGITGRSFMKFCVRGFY
jgi:hypothetical protein